MLVDRATRWWWVVHSLAADVSEACPYRHHVTS